jgi:DNA segregation ATPase FtsK/SpoIIIE-like protein
MLFQPPGTGYPLRVHGALSPTPVHRVVDYLKAQSSRSISRAFSTEAPAQW